MRAPFLRAALGQQHPVLKAAVPRRAFSSSVRLNGKNTIYNSVRRPEDLHTYLQLSSTARQPLVTFWTTSFCGTCRVVGPVLRSMVEAGVGEAEGGIGYCTVEYDAPDIMAAGFGMAYQITAIPTLLSFDAGEAQSKTRVIDGRQLADRHFLEEWLRTEARRRGGRGGGGSLFGGLFDSLK